VFVAGGGFWKWKLSEVKERQAVREHVAMSAIEAGLGGSRKPRTLFRDDKARQSGVCVELEQTQEITCHISGLYDKRNSIST
jgi:hypothetical protein